MNTMSSVPSVRNIGIDITVITSVTALQINSATVVFGVKNAVKFKDEIYICADIVFALREK